MRHIISELCDISDKSYYVWKNKSHSRLISLIEKYFSKDDLREFLETGKISRLEYTERINEIQKIFSRFKAIDFITYLVNSYAVNEVEQNKFFEYLFMHKTRRNDFSFVLEIIYNLLFETINEKKIETNEIIFQNILRAFNEKIKFDFHTSDINIIKQMMSEYKVYNNLYDLDKAPKD